MSSDLLFAIPNSIHVYLLFPAHIFVCLCECIMYMNHSIDTLCIVYDIDYFSLPRFLSVSQISLFLFDDPLNTKHISNASNTAHLCVACFKDVQDIFPQHAHKHEMCGEIVFTSCCWPEHGQLTIHSIHSKARRRAYIPTSSIYSWSVLLTLGAVIAPSIFDSSIMGWCLFRRFVHSQSCYPLFPSVRCRLFLFPLREQASSWRVPGKRGWRWRWKVYAHTQTHLQKGTASTVSTVRLKTVDGVKRLWVTVSVSCV